MFRKRSHQTDAHDPYAALRFPPFRLLILASFLTSFAQAILNVVIGWELYERTGSALALGIVGLVQIVPNLLLALPAGQYVDRHDRKRIVVLASSVIAAMTVVLAVLVEFDGPLVSIYAALFVIGGARAFKSPTMGTMLVAVIPEGEYGNASAWNSSSSHVAAIVGPAFGGLAIALFNDSASVFALSAVMLAIGAVLYSRMKVRPIAIDHEEMSIDSLLAGVRFIRKTKVLLASITLDMVAVLLGGATALLPIFAEDVLHVGATGLGLMRAAPAAGAVLTSLAIAHRGAFRVAGPTLLLTVAGFGGATILFGLSRSLGLSLAGLFMIGAFDAVSMVIRDTMELTYTPDHMRGRVSSVNYVFVGMSNEFGEFESGVAAAVFGATTAVVLGGIGTLIVVPLIALAWPEVRKLRRIEKPAEFAIDESPAPPVTSTLV